ncbi:MAG: S41 family peptidase [Planctomycetia bacterium]|nr:S41 family peptidase [Planctomycetia bacterium]
MYLRHLVHSCLTILLLVPAAVFAADREAGPRSRAVPAPLITTKTEETTEVQPLPKIQPLLSNSQIRETADLEKILQQGDDLFKKKEWCEARVFYEKAAKAYPDNKIVEKNYIKARCCLELNCRYRDYTFLSILKDTSMDEVRQLYNEVFTNIQTWHVDTPNWQGLLDHGIDGLEIAFGEPLFLSNYGITEKQAEILRRYCDSLREASRKSGIYSEKDLQNWIFKIAERIAERNSITEKGIVLEFICSITCSLDPWSSFLTPGQIRDIYSMIDGHFVGLGVELKASGKNLHIVRVIPGSPAEVAGLAKGEKITHIDGVSIESMKNTEDTGNLLQGKEGTTVSLHVQGEDQRIRNVVVERRRVDVPSVENIQLLGSKEEGDPVGYVRISCFQKTTASEMIAALHYLHQQGMQCLIIDLRQNPGGLLQEAIEVSDLFLDQGMIVRTRGRSIDRPYYARSEKICSIPLLVLIDENSASASEIFAGAIKENGRGRIVGTQSYGKGTVQALIRLKGTGAQYLIPGLRLTTEKFYSPNGSPYSGIGVAPDILVSGKTEQNRSDSPYLAARPVQIKYTDGKIRALSSKYSNDPCLNRAWTEALDILTAGKN